MIGSFAGSYRTKVARILDQPEAALQPPDLQTIVSRTVSLALANVGAANVSNKAPMRRINVLIDGRRTSVTLTADAVDRLVTAKGTKRNAHSFIRGLADRVPAGIANRSGWIEERVQTLLSFGSDHSEAGTATH